MRSPPPQSRRTRARWRHSPPQPAVAQLAGGSDLELRPGGQELVDEQVLAIDVEVSEDLLRALQQDVVQEGLRHLLGNLYGVKVGADLRGECRAQRALPARVRVAAIF